MWAAFGVYQAICQLTGAGVDAAGTPGNGSASLTLARAHEGATWFDAGAWSEDLADSYLAPGPGRRRGPHDRQRDPQRLRRDAVRAGGEADASGHEPRARLLWQQARAGYPDDVWVYVQAGIGYGDIGDHAEALEWLTTRLELALRTGDPEPALEQLRPRSTRASLWAREWEAPGSEFLP